MSPRLQTSQEFTDVASPWALHIQERLMEISHGVVGLGREDATNRVPLLSRGGEVPNVQDDRVGEALAHEVAGRFVLAVPLLGCQLLRVRGVIRILGNRTHFGTIKVAPPAGVPHCPLDAPGEYRPVGAFGIEVRDLGSQSDWLAGLECGCGCR